MRSSSLVLPPCFELDKFLRERNCVYSYFAREGFQNRSGSIYASTFARASIKTDIPRQGGASIINLASGQWPSSGRIDPAYTNIAKESETQTSATWVKSAAAITSTEVAATVPSVRSDGLTQKIDVTAGGVAESVRLNFGAAALTSATQSFYAIVQEGTAASFTLRIYETSARAQTLFTWVAGQLTIASTTAGTAEIRNIPGTNKWIAAVYCTTVNPANAARFDLYPAWSVTDGYTYVMGTQIVEGVNRILPYLPTTTAAVSTVADVLTANVGLSTGMGSERTYAMMWEQDYPLASYRNSDGLFLHSLDNTGGSLDNVSLSHDTSTWIVRIVDDSVTKTISSTQGIAAGRHVAIVSVKSGGSFLLIDGGVPVLSTDTFTHEGTHNSLTIGRGGGVTSEFSVRNRFFSACDYAASINEAHQLTRLILSANP